MQGQNSFIVECEERLALSHANHSDWRASAGSDWVSCVVWGEGKWVPFCFVLYTLQYNFSGIDFHKSKPWNILVKATDQILERFKFEVCKVQTRPRKPARVWQYSVFNWYSFWFLHFYIPFDLFVIGFYYRHKDLKMSLWKLLKLFICRLLCCLEMQHSGSDPLYISGGHSIHDTIIKAFIHSINESAASLLLHAAGNMCHALFVLQICVWSYPTYVY